MKAVVVDRFGPVADARVRTMPDPAPAPGEVVVAVQVAEMNYPDILVMEGGYQIRPPLPFVPGKAGAGVVASVGEGVTAPVVGDRVAFQVEYGAYAERTVVSAASCYPMPDEMTAETAAALSLTYQTAYFALVDRGAFKAGETVLVLGASGGVGQACVQLAKAMGASTVIGAARGADKVAAITSAGADRVVDLDMDDLREGLRQAVRAATDGQGADIVIDPVGGAAHAAAMRTLAWRGRLVVVGFASGDIPQIRGNYLLVKNIAVSGLQWSDYRERDPAWAARAQAEIFGHWQTGRITPQIGARLPLDRFADGLGLIKNGAVQGRVLLVLDP